MKPFLLSMLLGVALLALACGGGKKPSVSATPTTVGPPPTPTAVPKSDIDRLLANAGDEVAGWLRAQPWVYDGSDASLAVVESITSAAFDSDPAKAKAKQDEVMTLLHGLAQSTWYTGNLSEDDKAAVASVFDLALHLPKEAAQTYASTTELLHPELQKYDWQRELLDVLTQHHVTAVAGASESRIALLVATPDDDSLGDQVLADASSNLKAIEGLAGAIDSPRLLFVLDPDLNPDLCGEAIIEDFLILLKPTERCLTPEVVIHEITHVAVHAISNAVWFDEGVAELVALDLTGQTSPRQVTALRNSLTDQTFLKDASGAVSYGADKRRQDSNAGLLFLFDLKDEIGMDHLSRAIKDAAENGLGLVVGNNALKAILDATPPDKVEAVEALIADRCRTTQGSGGSLVLCSVKP